MELVNYGTTGLKVSRIGLGLAALGRPGYINLGHGNDLKSHDEQLMLEQTVSMLDEAYQLGIRYFDVARSYGRGEGFLSSWLANNPDKKDIVIGSKWGYTYTANWEVKAENHEIKEHSIEVLDRQYFQSTTYLGNRLKIYHIHSATQESGVLENKAVLDRLWELRNNGVIVGLSLSGATQGETLEKAMQVMRDGHCLFQSVQATWNILEPSVGEQLQQAASLGFGIIVKEALANGRLTTRNSSDTFKDKLLLLERLAEKHGVGIDAISIAYALRQPWVSTVLSGAATVEHLQSNLKAINVKLDNDDLAALGSLKESPDTYWETRSNLPWN